MSNMNDYVIDVFANAMKAAVNRDQSTSTTPGGRELEILFYGMMCFDPQRNGTYRVLFPNGMDLSALTDIPVHAAGLWVRDRGARATARWSGFAFRNDYFVQGKNKLTITGLAHTPLDATLFEGRVTSLKKCDPEFTIGPDPDAVIELLVDRGTLSAHVVNSQGMIVVRWAVQVSAGSTVRFTFGDDFVEIPPTVSQVFLANVSAGSEDTKNDFQLFRKLATKPAKRLEYKRPELDPRDTGPLVLDEPTFGYDSTPRRVVPAPAPGGGLPAVVGVVPQSGISSIAAQSKVFTAVAFSPNVVCSAVVSRPMADVTG